MAERLSATQSAFAPAGTNALLIDELTMVMVVGCALITVFVLGLVIFVTIRGRVETPIGKWVIGGGIVFPLVVLTALLAYGLIIGNALSVEAPDDAPTIRVTGKRWWWEVRYPDAPGGVRVVSANEVHIPVGRTVRLLLDTDDVIHSFWVPPLAGKIDMIPGRVNHLVLRADRAGVYRGQCAEYCGAQHAFMALYVIAHEPGDYERWLEREAAGAAAHAEAGRGRELFATAGCASCHAIRGTPAVGRLGPDLTHVASRLSIGAGMFDNNEATLAGWISNSQGMKPGNLMPPIRVPPEDLHALVAYMASLK
ncbi:MAG TPA: cytochrome c oxidase subunit II [Burkholderiales bacterium]|nr:cytochrome c oxidase subunit II [Burkholderiales bacterium]